MKTLYVELNDKNSELLKNIQLRTGFSIKQSVLEGLILLGQGLQILPDRLDFLAHGIKPVAKQE